MAKPRNLHIYNVDQEVLATLRSEYIQLGFDTELERGHLTVLTRPKRHKKSKKEKKKTDRNKRAESAARRN